MTVVSKDRRIRAVLQNGFFQVPLCELADDLKRNQKLEFQVEDVLVSGREGRTGRYQLFLTSSGQTRMARVLLLIEEGSPQILAYQQMLKRFVSKRPDVTAFELTNIFLSLFHTNQAKRFTIPLLMLLFLLRLGPLLLLTPLPKHSNFRELLHQTSHCVCTQQLKKTNTLSGATGTSTRTSNPKSISELSTLIKINLTNT